MKLSYPYYETFIKTGFSFLILSRHPSILPVCCIFNVQASFVKIVHNHCGENCHNHEDLEEFREYIYHCQLNNDVDFSKMSQVLLIIQLCRIFKSIMSNLDKIKMCLDWIKRNWNLDYIYLGYIILFIASYHSISIGQNELTENSWLLVNEMENTRFAELNNIKNRKTNNPIRQCLI